MKQPRALATMRAVALGLAALVLVPSASSATHAGLGPNTAPNPSFEFSTYDRTAADAAETAGVPYDQYLNSQPALPEGWAFEGSAGLFDHSQNGYRSGRRMVAISIPASGKKKTCGLVPTSGVAEVDNAVKPVRDDVNEEINDVCVDDPAGEQRSELERTYTVNPHWRTLRPITVEAGTLYRFSAYTWLSFVSGGSGAVTAVRWVDENGLTVGYSRGDSYLQSLDPSAPVDSGWQPLSVDVRAPSRAKGAILLLGHSVDVFLGQVRYDDVSFRVNRSH